MSLQNIISGAGGSHSFPLRLHCLEKKVVVAVAGGGGDGGDVKEPQGSENAAADCPGNDAGAADVRPALAHTFFCFNYPA